MLHPGDSNPEGTTCRAVALGGRFPCVAGGHSCPPAAIAKPDATADAILPAQRQDALLVRRSLLLRLHLQRWPEGLRRLSADQTAEAVGGSKRDDLGNERTSGLRGVYEHDAMAAQRGLFWRGVAWRACRSWRNLASTMPTSSHSGHSCIPIQHWNWL